MMDVSEVAAGAGRRAAGRDVPAPRRHSQQMLDIAVRTAAFIILLAGCLIVLVPLLWMLSTSLKTDPEIFANPPQWIRRLRSSTTSRTSSRRLRWRSGRATRR